MDAIECGIVKLPRIPVVDNAIAADDDMPKFRSLWEHIGGDLPRKGAAKSGELDPKKLPALLQTALFALYDHYTKVYRAWREVDIRVPPVFIVVCTNTAVSM
jgi:type III restriction enzyme